MALKEIDAEVVSGRDGSKKIAVVLECESCGSRQFLALLVGDGRYMHLQCMSCDAMYCKHEGPCAQGR